MAEINRTADVVWNGGLRQGDGHITTESSALSDAYYGFPTRFESTKGTNPEELVAAAHAACYSMNLAATLEREGHPAQRIHTRAVCTLASQQPAGFKITRSRLETSVKVAGLEESAFQEIARRAEATCPVSNALRGGVEIELSATLEPA